MADETTETTQEVTTPEPEPTPAPAPAPVSDSVKKQAAYFARKPDEFEAVLNELGKASSAEANQRVDQLQRELTVRDALSDNELTRADAAFITGNTPEEINASAKALKARIGTPPVPPNGEVPEREEIKAPDTPDPIPPLPENRGQRSSVEQAEADFAESFAQHDFSEFTR